MKLSTPLPLLNHNRSHPVRVRGLKRDNTCIWYGGGYESHPVRVRGLKLEFEVNHGVVKTSHPVRVRGLKLGGDG